MKPQAESQLNNENMKWVFWLHHLFQQQITFNFRLTLTWASVDESVQWIYKYEIGQYKIDNLII